MMLGLAEKRIVVFGMGISTYACARYFAEHNLPFVVLDTRESPSYLPQFKQSFNDAKFVVGDLSNFTFSQNDYVLVSPGVALTQKDVVRAKEAGAYLSSDIELFLQCIEQPVIAITGSNGKSTVSKLLEHMLNCAGQKAIACGNIGYAVFDALLENEAQIYVLELSSFQLERLPKLNAHAATILNISEDHLDRYESIDDYIDAKRQIFNGCKHKIIRQGDNVCDAPAIGAIKHVYGFEKNLDVSAIAQKDGSFDIYCEQTLALNSKHLKLKGKHNIANVMAALSLALTWVSDISALAKAATVFAGLKHRCQWVANIAGVNFYNDSKATNVGAAEAAISGLANNSKNIILIAGGQGKDGDFSLLLPAVKASVKHSFLIGEDAALIAKALSDEPTTMVDALPKAVQNAFAMAEKGDVVLLAPACASFDMFQGFEARGESFIEAVKALEAQHV